MKHDAIIAEHEEMVQEMEDLSPRSEKKRKASIEHAEDKSPPKKSKSPSNYHFLSINAHMNLDKLGQSDKTPVVSKKKITVKKKIVEESDEDQPVSSKSSSKLPTKMYLFS